MGKPIFDKKEVDKRLDSDLNLMRDRSAKKVIPLFILCALFFGGLILVVPSLKGGWILVYVTILLFGLVGSLIFIFMKVGDKVSSNYIGSKEWEKNWNPGIVMCEAHLTCNNIGCSHKIEHFHHTRDCKICYKDNIEGSTCVDSIKLLRKEKLIKLNENKV